MPMPAGSARRVRTKKSREDIEVKLASFGLVSGEQPSNQAAKQPGNLETKEMDACLLCSKLQALHFKFPVPSSKF